MMLEVFCMVSRELEVRNCDEEKLRAGTRAEPAP